MPKCCYCGGRGWVWVGIASNAIREPCGPCDGRGRWHRVNWGVVGGLVAVLFSMALSFAIIHFSVSLAHGQTAGGMTLKEFRQQPPMVKSALVAGAMATTEHVGMQCPDPQRTVAEYVSALTWRKLDDQKPWVAYYFTLTNEHGCRIEDDAPVSSDEGA